MNRLLTILIACVSIGAWAQEILLTVTPADAVGDWAQALLPLRLRATPAQEVAFEGPPVILSQWGEITLGTARYTFLVGVRADGQADLWVDINRDRRITPDEMVVPTRAPGYVEWQVELMATPAGGQPFPYPLTVVWPEGRGYVYLVGGAPRWGEVAVDGVRATIVVVDGDLDGVYGTKGDFYAVDVDGDGTIHGDPDGHERFALGEPFTLGGKSYRLSQIDPGGAWVRLAPAAYVDPKPPLLPGYPAPDLRFDAFLDGRPVALSALRGKVVLVDFWATWCGPCMNELPALVDLYAARRGDGFEIVAVSLDTNERDLRTVLATRDIQWPVAFEGKSWDNSLAQLYRVYQIPTSYLLDRSGTIRYRDVHGEELAQRVDELLSSPRVDEPRPPTPVLGATAPPRPILDVKVPGEIGLVPGVEDVIAVQVINSSPYEAEEVTFAVLGLPPQATSPTVEVPSIPGFAERTVRLTIALGESGAPVSAGSLEVLYHYCIGDSCFQIKDTVPLAFAFGETRARAGLPTWWLLVAIGVGLVVAMFLRGRALTAVGIVLIGLAAGALTVGLFRGQATQAWRIGSVLCTACVGIEEVRAEAPILSPQELEAVRQFAGSARLVVFHTPWCKSCPYAKALVAELARLNPAIAYELVDAERDRTRAEAAGVIQSGRVIVPAILVEETGRVLFGTSSLLARILVALAEVP
ncbi:MAG: hypothetical protein BIP78_0881 [Candidatus Bipolaricaulis sibiricus]|uniref:Thioredoxin domain-containing protein n=1 Tax=Bipolaricaulis sibiricus TaxID=2501609 RepID=A0A410FU75_BIPS1|nr:MAG: hypothetical protein BIP78_0881 [Candidatus Bipolaricaulis sibiricus]